MGKYIADFSEFGVEDIAEVGGKGGNLGELTCAGFSVPPGFCVKAAGFDTFIKDNNLLAPIENIASAIDFKKVDDVEEKTARIRGLITSADIPAGIMTEISDAYVKLQHDGTAPLVAVRSSVGTRDLSRSSFPGQMDTYHNLRGIQMVLDCIQKCWASVWSARAAITVHSKKIDFNMVFIAPLVQLMVPSDTAGVIFTANPINSNKDELMINSGYGLGESVVSGNITPDHYVINKTKKEILSSEPGDKKYKTILDTKKGCGNQKVKLTRDEASRECLTQDQIKELIDLGISIEAHYGFPQDVEWAYVEQKLYVLQSRRITGLASTNEKETKEIPTHPHIVWSRKFGDEYLADYTTPLSYTILVRWISEDYFKEIARLQGRKDLEDLEPIRKYNGYAYINGLYIARMLQPVSKDSRILDSLNWFPPFWNDRIMAEPFKPWLLFGSTFSLLKDPRAGVNKNQTALETHCKNIEKQIIPKLFQDYTRLSADDWQKQFDEANEFGREHFRVIRWGVGFNNPLLHNTLSKQLEEWADDKNGQLYQDIISGLPNTRTAEINKNIWQLGIDVRNDSHILSLFRNDDLSYEELRQSSPESPFWITFDNFIRQHGHRAATREISHPRWRETPEIILNLIRAQLQPEIAPPDPVTVAVKAVQLRQKAEQEALKKTGQSLLGWLRKPILRWVYEKTQAYTLYRENQRYHLDYILTHMRQLLLEQGKRLMLKGVLNSASEIFFLEKDEFWSLVASPVFSKKLRIKIDKRLKHYSKWQDRLPATYLYDDVEVEEEFSHDGNQPADTDNLINGLGASRGSVKGSVRIIAELKNLNHIKTGEILVVNNIDPGWTNVFPLIGGLITETGGLLAHGALLAREYGIPAVMGISGATAKFETGELIEINGSAGYIRRLGENKE